MYVLFLTREVVIIVGRFNILDVAACFPRQSTAAPPPVLENNPAPPLAAPVATVYRSEDVKLYRSSAEGYSHTASHDSAAVHARWYLQFVSCRSMEVGPSFYRYSLFRVYDTILEVTQNSLDDANMAATSNCSLQDTY